MEHFLFVVALCCLYNLNNAQPINFTSLDDFMLQIDPGLNLRVSPRIVGGYEALPGQFPWLANKNRECGATLIHKEWILTAGHCRMKVGDSITFNRWNILDKTEPTAEFRTIVQSIPHPKYDYDSPSERYDICLCKLDAPSQHTPPARLVTEEEAREYEQPNQVLTVAGWGQTGYNAPRSTTLRWVNVPVMANDKCGDSRHYGALGKTIWDSNLCAGRDSGGIDSCKGDSGGPLFLEIGGQGVVVGVVSWGAGCANAYAPGVYTKVSSYRDWIYSFIPSIQDLTYYDNIYAAFSSSVTPSPTTSKRTSLPTPVPTPRPTPLPTPFPTPFPTPRPTLLPTRFPTPLPTPLPTPFPTPFPTPLPTTSRPTPFPSSPPTSFSLPPTSFSLPPTPLPSFAMTTSASSSLSVTPKGSCKDKCGQVGSNNVCYCDAGCENTGDCCFDYSSVCVTNKPPTAIITSTSPTAAIPTTSTITPANPTQSCVGTCGAFTGECWCDDLCKFTNDCCVDIFPVCGIEGTVGSNSNSPAVLTSQVLPTPAVSSTFAPTSPPPTSLPTVLVTPVPTPIVKAPSPTIVASSGTTATPATSTTATSLPPPPPTLSLDSCVGRCVGRTPGRCFCDAACVANKDCCNDIIVCGISPTNTSLEIKPAPSLPPPTTLPPTPIPVVTAPPTSLRPTSLPTNTPTFPLAPTVSPKDSCKNKCGSESLSGFCFCDSECYLNSDCCVDYESSCVSAPLSASNTVQPKLATPPPLKPALPTAAPMIAPLATAPALATAPIVAVIHASPAAPISAATSTAPVALLAAAFPSFAGATMSCVGRCQKDSFSNTAMCFCDSSCLENFDCCADYSICQSLPQRSSSSTSMSQSSLLKSTPPPVGTPAANLGHSASSTSSPLLDRAATPKSPFTSLLAVNSFAQPAAQQLLPPPIPPPTLPPSFPAVPKNNIFGPLPKTSCENLCGKLSIDGSCFCDSSCITNGDCCKDFTSKCGVEPSTVGGSCFNSCGVRSTGSSCSCDEQCTMRGDCCADVQRYCSWGNSCAGNCGGHAKKCFCDSGCLLNGDCCSDYSKMCSDNGKNQLMKTEVRSSGSAEGNMELPASIFTCVGRCGSPGGGSILEGFSCSCDLRTCVLTNECCSDLTSVCTFPSRSAYVYSGPLLIFPVSQDEPPKPITVAATRRPSQD